MEIVPINIGSQPELTRLASSISTYFLPNNRRMGCIDETRLQASSSTIRFFGPSKLEFNFYKMGARMWMRLMKEEGIKIRRVGFTFKNLNVLWRDKVCQKAGLCDGGGNGSERRVKSQRHVVTELNLLSPCVYVDAISLTEAKRSSPSL